MSGGVWFRDNRGAPVSGDLSTECWHGGEHDWTPTHNRVGKLTEERCAKCHVTRWAGARRQEDTE